MHQRDGNWICWLLTLLWMVLVLCLCWTHVWCLLGCFYFSNFFSGNQGLCWPNLTLQSVDWASTLSSSKYFLAHSFLVATGLPEAGFQLYWMYGKLMTALVSVQWRSSLSSSPARRMQLHRTGSSMRLQFLIITAVCGKQVASEADCLCLQPQICQTLVAPRWWDLPPATSCTFNLCPALSPLPS